MGCGGSRHDQTEIEENPIRLHHQIRNNDQNKPCMEEDSVKSYITSEDSSTPKFKYNEEERFVEGSRDQDFADEDVDDQRRICSSSPSFKIYLPENLCLGQDKEKDGDGDGGNNENGGQCVYDHQFQETIIEEGEAKKGVLRKRLSKYRIMMSKRWR